MGTIGHGMSARDALEKLKAGNRAYLGAEHNDGGISLALREKTAGEGQYPYAAILSCSDSRVVPEHIFMAGIGELFVIRVAGNVAGSHQLGSIEYAASHLGCRLAVVLGHTRCGAIDAAIHCGPEGHIQYLTDEIKLAIGDETDDRKACERNVRRAVSVIGSRLEKDALGLSVVGAVYDVETGRVDFLEE